MLSAFVGNRGPAAAYDFFVIVFGTSCIWHYSYNEDFPSNSRLTKAFKTFNEFQCELCHIPTKMHLLYTVLCYMHHAWVVPKCHKWLWLQVRCICVLISDAGAVPAVVSAAAGVDRRLPSHSDEHQSEELCRHSAGGEWPASVLLHLPRSQRPRDVASAPSRRPHGASLHQHRPPQPASQTSRRQVPRPRGIRLLGRRFQYWCVQVVRVRLTPWTRDVAG